MKRRSQGKIKKNNELDVKLRLGNNSLRFASILDISIWTLVSDSLNNYFAKIQSIQGVPYFIVLIFSILIFTQILFPPLLLNCLDIWPDDSVLSTAFRILSVMWDGYDVKHQEKRIVISLILSLIYIMVYILITLRALLFTSNKIISTIEIMAVRFLLRNAFLFFLPLLINGFPLACHNLSQNYSTINAVTIILILIAFTFYVYFYYILTVTRVLLENSPLHIWLPSIYEIPSYVHSICISIATTVGYVKFQNPKTRVVIPIVMMIIYFCNGCILFIGCNFISQKMVLIYSTATFTASFISLFQIVNIAIGKSDQSILIILLIVSFVFILLLLKLIHKRRVLSMLQFCDSCCDNSISEYELMENRFKNSFHFMFDIKLIIDKWHPYMMTWKLFDFALQKWPKDINIVILYGRLVSFFPALNSTMLWAATMIAKLSFSFSRTYFLQFIILSESRQTKPSQTLNKKASDIQFKIESLLVVLRKFWEKILQKNFSNFWDDVDLINKRITKIDSMLNQMIIDYPNCVEVFKLYKYFINLIYHDYKKEKRIEEIIKILEFKGIQKADIAKSMAIIMFPNIQTFYNEPIEKSTLVYERDGNMDDNEDVNPTDSNAQQIKILMQELTEHTKLGRVWISIIVYIFMTAIVLYVFYLFQVEFQNSFLIKNRKALDLLTSFGHLRYGCAHLDFIVLIHPLLLGKKLISNNSTMYVIAPNLYSKYRVIPPLKLDHDYVQYLITNLSVLITTLKGALYNLDQSEIMAKEILNLLIYEPVIDNLNMDNTLSQIIKDAETLLESHVVNDFMNSFEHTRITTYFYHLHNFLATVSDYILLYSSSDYSLSFSKLKDKMVLVVVVCVILVTFPFMFVLFVLQTENEAISDSFSFFPNSEIRGVINRFGSYETKKEDDVSLIANVSQTSKDHRTESLKLITSLMATFFILIIYCITIYFISMNFINGAQNSSMMIWSLFSPFTKLFLAMKNVIQLLTIDSIGGRASIRDIHIDEAMRYAIAAEKILSLGMWGPIGTVNYFYSSENSEMNFFTGYFKKNTTQKKSLFEFVVTLDFPVSIDCLCGSIKKYVNKAKSEVTSTENPDFLSLLYYFSNFCNENRNQIYFQIIEKETAKIMKYYIDRHTYLNFFVMVWQALTCILILFILFEKSKRIKHSLRFFHDISPYAVMQNHHTMQLIETGKKQAEHCRTSFSNSELIISHILQGVIIMNKDLVITSANNAFLKIVKTDISSCGKPITEVIKMCHEDHSWPDFIEKITKTFSGIIEPQFSDYVTVLLNDNSVAHFKCDVICLSLGRPTRDGEYDTIVSCAVVIDDQTNSMEKLTKIHREQNESVAMVSSVIPKQLLSDLIGGEEQVSFVVQSVTSGDVYVHVVDKESMTLWQRFDLYNRMFVEIDALICDFDLICKTRTSANHYTFASGLFSQINKPEKHADQSIRFALATIGKLKEFAAKNGTDIEIKVGVHSGGPVITGIMDLCRPTFQIIGPVMEFASCLAKIGDPSQVIVSRAVYELVFTSGFRVFEKGEVMIRENAIQTYQISS